MTRKLEIVLLFILVAAVLGFVVLTQAPKETADQTSPQGDKAPSPARETTIRNVTDKTLAYKVYPLNRPEDLEEKSIPPGAIDRYRTDDVLEIEFNNGEKDLIYSLDPGSPYSFRYDQGTSIDLFLGAHGRADAEDLAPYVPTPMVVVEEMLSLAGVAEQDVVYDLGCGDGRIVITAAIKFGARGVGIDIDPARIEESVRNAEEAGVSHLVKFIQMDATKADFSEATVLALYLLPESNALLRPKLEEQLRPGTRIVCHNYAIPDWESKQTAALSLKDDDGEEHNIFAYVR